MSIQFDQSRLASLVESNGHVDAGGTRTRSRPSRQSLYASAGTVLLRGLLGSIIQTGTLRLIGPDGRVHRIGCGGPAVGMRVLDGAIIPRLLADPDLAFGEAYMDGAIAIEDGDIYDFLDLCFRNLGWGSGHWIRRLQAAWRRFGRRIAQHNPIPVARANVAHHYDLSDTLYELFLDPDRQYFCAYYCSPDDSLERAQEQKKRHLAAKLLLRPGQRLLDIGSGWTCPLSRPHGRGRCHRRDVIHRATPILRTSRC